MPAMRLPFDRITPGTFASAFPKSPTTGLPAEIQGVETQAKMAMRPAPVINTTASDRVAAMGRNAAPAPAGMTMTAAPMPAAPMMRTARNPFGGMDSRPLSERAGPMGYAPQGVGTNNPNAYAVGRNNRNFAERTGMMSPAPMPAPVMRQGPMMLGGPAVPAPVPGGMAMSPAAAPTAAAPNGIDAFLNQMSQDTTAFMGEQDAARAATAEAEAKAAEEQQAQRLAMRVTTKKIPGTDYVIPFSGTKAMGTLPVQKPEMQMTADDVAAARAMGGDVSIQQGNTQVRLPGMTQAQPGEVKLPKIFQGKDDNMGKPGRDYYYEPDAQTGRPRKVYIEDADGDGVPDNQQGAAVAAAAPKKSRFMDLINQR